MDEFTKHRVKKDVGKRGTPQEEIKAIKQIDPYQVVQDSHGEETDVSTDEFVGAHMSAWQMRNEMIQARLDAIGDVSTNSQFTEVIELMQAMEFQVIFDETPGDESSLSRVMGWANPANGIIIIANAYRDRLNDAQLYAQWSPALDSMTERQNADIQSRLINSDLYGGWFDPVKPHLNHSTLHYQEGLLEGDLDQEKARWLWQVNTGCRDGIKYRVQSLTQQGKLISPWQPGSGPYSLMQSSLLSIGNSEFENREALSAQRMAQTPEWFQEMIANAKLSPEEVEANKVVEI